MGVKTVRAYYDGMPTENRLRVLHRRAQRGDQEAIKRLQNFQQRYAEIQQQQKIYTGTTPE